MDSSDGGSESGSASDSGSTSRSSSSDGSGSSSAERTERATVLGTSFQLPKELCEQPAIFKEFLSMGTWNGLSEPERRHLRRFLPEFSENDAEEKENTLRMLFSRENFKFSSPLELFHSRLRNGAFRPGSAKLRKAARVATERLTKKRRKRFWRQSFGKIVAAREALLAAARAAPPPQAGSFVSPRPPPSPEPRMKRIADRTRRRYFQELSAISSRVFGDGFVSDDETYPDGPPPPLPKRYCRYLNELQDDDATIISTFGRGLHFINGTTCFNEDWKKRALLVYKRKRQRQPNSSELNVNGITLGSVKVRTGGDFNFEDYPTIYNKVSNPKPKRNKKLQVPIVPPAPPSPFVNSDSENDVKQFVISGEIPNSKNSSSAAPLRPSSPKIKMENVENGDNNEEIGLQLIQETHACFFSVIRDLVCNTQSHSLPIHLLEARLRNWRQNPIAPLNHWYSAVEDWVKALSSAVSFLMGENQSHSDDFVPYLQYKPAIQVYQWIGAGRDSDALLTPLYNRWLSQRQSKAISSVLSTQSNPSASTPTPLETVEIQSVQIPKWNAQWQISTEELEAFRSQEVLRFQRPHRAFTYCLPRGNIVVGPLKGVYGCDEPGTANNRVARGHCLLTATRPRHVTLLALVRDAVASLPGGEGTRAHITALVRRSQYIVADAQEQPLQAAVSGALDRMHAAVDPCVQYLPARKLWVYLHGNRTEEEFERLHAEMQIQNKNKTVVQQKKSSAKSKQSKSAKSTKPAITSVIDPTNISVVEDEGEGEDINVDVESPEVTATIATNISTNSSSVSGASLLQPRTSLNTTMLKRNLNTIQAGNLQSGRNMVRVLSSSNTTGKSLINPNALQSSVAVSETNIQSTLPQSRVVVQRPVGQPTTGALAPQLQKRLLDSLMRHQRQHGQPMTHDQLLHTINSTQKMSQSPPPMSSISSTVKTSTVQTVQHSGQMVQLSPGQTLQLAGQTVQLTGQTLQLAGQTVQIGGQSVQLLGQTRAVNDASVRLSSQRQPSNPLVAKILTNTQLRGSGGGNISNQTTGLRLSGLSLTQLQGKPLLLQTNSSTNKTQNILLQTGNLDNANTATIIGTSEQRPRVNTPTTQHTLLLSNLGGQVVRVAGSGLLGQSLRLQSPSQSNTIPGNSGVLLGGTALKLQTTPIRLNQNVASSGTSNRVLLAGGARLHGLKLLPVQQSITKGNSGRQVYAKIVNSTTVSNASPAASSSLIVGIKTPSPTTTTAKVHSPNQLPQNR